jgi:hypothetical protein
VDLFVPGSGTPAAQVHDNNAGIYESGLFWTVPAADHDLRVRRHGRRAVLEMDAVPLVDSFQFFGPTQVPSRISCRVDWEATGPFVTRGSGDDVPPTDKAAFLGDIAPARSRGWFKGEEWGFSFESRDASEAGGWAQLGRVRNGVFLD